MYTDSLFLTTRAMYVTLDLRWTCAGQLDTSDISDSRF